MHALVLAIPGRRERGRRRRRKLCYHDESSIAMELVIHACRRNICTSNGDVPLNLGEEYTQMDDPTDYFTIFEPQNQAIDMFYVAQKRRSSDLGAPKLCYVLSGCSVVELR